MRRPWQAPGMPGDHNFTVVGGKILLELEIYFCFSCFGFTEWFQNYLLNELMNEFYFCRTKNYYLFYGAKLFNKCPEINKLVSRCTKSNKSVKQKQLLTKTSCQNKTISLQRNSGGCWLNHTSFPTRCNVPADHCQQPLDNTGSRPGKLVISYRLFTYFETVSYTCSFSIEVSILF